MTYLFKLRCIGVLWSEGMNIMPVLAMNKIGNPVIIVRNAIRIL